MRFALPMNEQLQRVILNIENFKAKELESKEKGSLVVESTIKSTY